MIECHTIYYLFIYLFVPFAWLVAKPISSLLMSYLVVCIVFCFVPLSQYYSLHKNKCRISKYFLSIFFFFSILFITLNSSFSNSIKNFTSNKTSSGYCFYFFVPVSSPIIFDVIECPYTYRFINSPAIWSIFKSAKYKL